MADPVNWADPCARAAALRSAYFAAISGQARAVRFQTGEHIQSVEYGPTNAETLRTEMLAAESECQALSGKPVSRRHAIQIGARTGVSITPLTARIVGEDL